LPLIGIGGDETTIVANRDTAANDPGRIASGNRTAGDVLGHHAAGADHAIVTDGNARQDQALPADEAVSTDTGMEVKAAGAIMRHDPCIKGDIAVFGDMHPLRKGQVRLGAQ